LLTQVNSKLLECMRSVVTKGQVAYGYQHRVLMTGTPLQNNTVELWSLMNFIEPAKFPDLEKFTQKYGSITTQEQVGAGGCFVDVMVMLWCPNLDTVLGAVGDPHPRVCLLWCLNCSAEKPLW
jgi:hypothetical protein